MRLPHDLAPGSASCRAALLLGSLTLIAAPSAQAQMPYAHRPVNPQAAHALVADLDGDGKNDIVLHAHRDDHHLGKVPGRQRGLSYLRWPTFEEVVIYRGDVAGDRFFATDLNRDGRIDLVSAEILTDGRQVACWFENPPAGHPGAWRRHEVGSIPRGEIKDVLAGDIDRDGRPDLAVRMVDSTELFFQRPDGWRARSVAHVKREGLALADLDLDGDLDLVLNGFWLETPADVLRGDFVRHDIDAKWFNQDTGKWPDNAAYVRVADLNRDGLPDVVLCHSEKVGYPVAWYSVERLDQVKTGPWREHVIAPEFDWCETLDVGDIDNDGDLDVFAAKFQRHDKPGGAWYNEPPFPVTVFVNVKGDGSEWRRQDLAMDGVYAGMLGDVGSDGDLDIVGPRSYWTGPIRLWENQTSDRWLALDRWTYRQLDDARARYGDFPAEGVKPWVRYFGLAAGDLSNDRRLDLVSGRYFYRNPGGDMTAKWDRVDFGVNVDACLILDVDGDAFGDVIGLALPDIYWLEANDRAGTKWTARKIGTAPRTGHDNSQGFAVGQIVPGGRPEFAIATEAGVYYFEVPAQPESDPWPRTLITTEASDEGLDLADVDGDGWVDLVAGHGEKGVAWWRNPAGRGGEWRRVVVGETAPNPVDRVKVRDLNGDGRPDIVVTEERYPGKEPDANLWWFETPADPATSNWKRHRVITTWSLNNLDAADFDRDGDIDLVTAEHKGAELRLLLFENDGKGRFTERVLDRGKESHLGTLAADLDGDGDPDLVSIGWDRHKFLHLWRNDAVSRAVPADEGAAIFCEVNLHPGAKPGKQISELDPGTQRKFEGQHAWAAKKARHVPQTVRLDLAQARRAELSVEYWGGHIGTGAQQFQVNGFGWVDLPQPVGTPAAPQRYYRTLLGNNATPVPLEHLRPGENQVQFAAGPQVAYGFDFGFYWIYDFTMRVYYDSARPHPTGEIVAPRPGDTFGDSLQLEARASSPNGAIVRVDFIGEYDDFDWDGDGVWREWQYATRYGVLQRHLGTATAAPWRVTWDARWIPDQTQPVRVRARVTDATGLTTLTPPVANLAQRRTGRAVRMYPVREFPEKFAARAGGTARCNLEFDGNPAQARAARLVMSSWSASTDVECPHELRFNGTRLANRFGQFHEHSFDTLELPVSLLRRGANEIAIYSEYKGHALELNWPGPVLLVEF